MKFRNIIDHAVLIYALDKNRNRTESKRGEKLLMNTEHTLGRDKQDAEGEEDQEVCHHEEDDQPQ